MHLLTSISDQDGISKDVKHGLETSHQPPALRQIAGDRYENCSRLGFVVSFCRDTMMTTEKVS